MESYNSFTQEIGEGNASSSENKRNKKTQALNALLSATALGVFLEGCGGEDIISGGDGAPHASLPSFSADAEPEPYEGVAASEDTELMNSVSYENSPTGVTADLQTPENNLGAFAVGDTYGAPIESSIGIANLIGSAFKDTLSGDGERNILEGKQGADIIDGRGGLDTASYASSLDRVVVNLATGAATGGDAEGDTFNSIEGIIGSWRNDILTGDSGDNFLLGNAGNDILSGGAGRDTYSFPEFGDSVSSRRGEHDRIQGDPDGGVLVFTRTVLFVDNEVVTGVVSLRIEREANGDIRIYSVNDQRTVTIDASSFANGQYTVFVRDNELGRLWLTRTDGEDLTATADADWIIGRAGDNTLRGNGGNDRIYGGDGDDILYGGEGNDFLHGGDGSNILYGGAGDDALRAYSTSVGVTNTFYGEDGDDYLSGGNGTNILHGGNDDDFLRGGRQDDTLNGDAGNDTLEGGQGADRLNGGAGTDTYVFNVGDGSDTITDMAGDTIHLSFYARGTYEASDFGQSAFVRNGNNLEITVRNDKVTIVDAYDSNSNTGIENSAFTITAQHLDSDYELQDVVDVWSMLT